MLFEFPSAVSAVSAFMNYYTPLLGAPTLEVLDAGFNVLESYDLGLAAPINTPGGANDGAWRGIVRGAADITALRVINSYTVVDDLTFGGVPDVVPEPASLALLGAGIAGLMVRRRAVDRRR